MLKYDTTLCYRMNILKLSHLWQHWILGISPLSKLDPPCDFNNSLIIFHLQNHVCRLSVVPLVPSDWFNHQSLAREYRYRHALLYGSNCWLVVMMNFNQTKFRMKTLSSVYGICWIFLSNVSPYAGVSSGLCLKEMMHTQLLQLWLTALPTYHPTRACHRVSVRPMMHTQLLQLWLAALPYTS